MTLNDLQKAFLSSRLISKESVIDPATGLPLDWGSLGGGLDEAEIQALIDASVNALIAGAPGALNTLDELSAALGDDASYAATITTALAGKQPLDSDLTAIAAIAPANDDVIQRKSGAWTNRTMAQLLSDLPTSAANGCKVYNSTTQNVNTTTAVLTYDSEEYDADGFHSTSSNPSRLTVPAGMDGRYLILAGSSASTTGMTDAFLRKNGTTRLISNAGYSGYGAGGEPLAVSVVDLVAGDYIEMVVTTVNNENFGHATDGNKRSSITMIRQGGVVGPTGPTGPSGSVSGAIPGRILGETVDTGGARTITSATLVNIPTTAITVTFTAPASGSVDVELAATASGGTSGSAYQTWGILDNSNAVIAGAIGESIAARNADAFTGAIKRFRLTGLTPGASVTYKWAAASSTNDGSLKANSNSPAIMRVVEV